MPHLPARLGFALAVVCCLLRAPADGKTLRFDEYDVELTVPADWRPSAPEPGVVVVMHDQIAQKIGGDTSSGSKAVALMVTTFPKEVAIDTAAFADRQREAMQQKGAVVVGTGKRAVGPLLYHTTKIANRDMEQPVSYLCTTFGNDRAVTLVLSSRVVDPSTDPQLEAILQSVHFISAYRPITELTLRLRVKAFTLRHPVAVTALGVVGIAAIVVFAIILKQSSAEARPRKS
jgi:hypothetical protein